MPGQLTPRQRTRQQARNAGLFCSSSGSPNFFGSRKFGATAIQDYYVTSVPPQVPFSCGNTNGRLRIHREKVQPATTSLRHRETVVYRLRIEQTAARPSAPRRADPAARCHRLAGGGGPSSGEARGRPVGRARRVGRENNCRSQGWRPVHSPGLAGRRSRRERRIADQVPAGERRTCPQSTGPSRSPGRRSRTASA